VAVRVGPAAGGDPESAARESALLRRLEHENVVRLRAVLDLADGDRAVVTDLAAGGSLAALVQRRGALPVGEVVTVAVGLARGLAAAHAHGFVHGRLTARAVLFGADGRPQLADLGLDTLLGPAGDDPPGLPVYPSPADDVAALGEVLRYALRGGAPGPVTGGPLLGVLQACLAADPQDRPTAHRVALLALEAALPAPVELLDVAAGESRAEAPIAAARQSRADAPIAGGPAPHGRRATRTAGVVAGGVLTAAALTAGAFALALHGGGVAAAPSVGRPVGPASRPVAASGSVAVPPLAAGGAAAAAVAVPALATARAHALSTPSEAALALVDAPRSAADAVDRAFVHRLGSRGLRLSGLSFAVSSVRPLTSGAGGATVEVRVATSGYAQVRADGSVAQRVPPTPARTVRLTLVPTPSGWRISSAL
jgi:eukaryotic-like serine/threonine-protein kinase